MAKCLRVVADDKILWTLGDDDETARFSPNLTAADFLKSGGAGAYTTARTCQGGTRVFELSRHIERLSESASLLGGGENGGGESGGGAPSSSSPLPPPPRSLRDPSLLRPRILSLLRLGLLGKAEKEEKKDGSAVVAAAADPALGGQGGKEFRVTILATWSAETFSLSLHVAPLPPPQQQQPVVALILSGGGGGGESADDSCAGGGVGGRRRAAAKGTSWVSERAALEAAGRAAGAEEVLLVEEEEEEGGGGGGGGRAILEGLSSNFAAVAPLSPGDGGEDAAAANAADAAADAPALYGAGFELQTAGEGRVLSGTVRGLLLAVAARSGFAVKAARCPSVEEARNRNWVGCLLLSTSRLALPVAELREERRWARKAAAAATAEAEKEAEEKKEGSEENGKEEKKEEGGGAEPSSSSLLIASFLQDGKFHPVVERLSREVAAAVEGASESII